MRIVFALITFVVLFASVSSCRKSGSSSGSATPKDTLGAWQKTKVLSSADDIWFVSSTKGFVCSSDTIFRSLDGGNTWAAAPGNPNGVYNLQFLDNQTGAAIGRLSLYTTSNGGDLWVKRTLPDVYSSSGPIVYSDIQMISSSTASSLSLSLSITTK